MIPTTLVKLPNGLTIHLKEIHTAPIISHWVWYRIGSRDERSGLTGISHWVEHMQFKGTPTFPAGSLDKAISREGGFWNAFTHLDWTTFFETLPADKIDLGLRLEADRMVNSLYEEAEVESERTVILSEREGNENEPLFRLGEAVQQAAFDRHPYRNEIIGLPQDLAAIQRPDLYQHYHAHYHPGNALVTVAGDFETEAMLKRLENLYGAIPAGEPVDHPARPESPLTAERRIEVKGPGKTTFLQLSYRAPDAANPDFFPFSVMDSLLTGPTSLNMFGGGGTSNKTSRLYRALVEKELAIGVSGGTQATIDPFLYDITITVRPGKNIETILSAVDAEIDRLQQEDVHPDEIARAIKQARAIFAYGSENITNQAFWLGYAEMFDHYEWFVEYMRRLEQVTPAELQRIAREYLASSRRVVGIYIPSGEEDPKE
ncbi:predicted Zn-dependent peptidase [Longilinea arvoryzae]|uniref:Predicted Zn-dependent peptidase n=1 Tax=Longilinea arvoryzae TaxID=360412 RepID=A0A0S7BCF8_9CHLR|nr:pitrilysin family protein [Longilinea arvoryzae]GAP15415.1 predicted Zn-dependent peptidase [Longilinea arvoryzae]